MISSKKLLKMARKWQKLATISRKRISFPRTKGHFDEGHFVVYTADQRRFVIPLAYLNTELFRELLKMAEEDSKKLIQMARKWQKLATISRKRISFPRTKFDEGHFVVYTADQRRFVIPLAYLNTELFRKLLKMAEEEYGLPIHGDPNLLLFLRSINQSNMISPKKIVKMARKWQKLATIKRKRISLPRAGGDDSGIISSSSSSVTDKGHFVVNTADQRRFVLPFVYLNNDVFR
ncbi:hypothetical protein U1Q18_034642 [Sarracenia purpurea var. burkii]